MEPIEKSTRWDRWKMMGASDVLTKVLRDLELRFPNEWKRLSGEELNSHLRFVQPGSAWYAFTMTPSCAGITLSLERVGDSELRGGRIWFAGPPETASVPNIAAAWDQVMRFLDEGVVPAAQAHGAVVRIPTPEDIFISELPFDIADRLRTFSEAARKSLPLDRKEADLWSAFVIGAFRVRAVIDSRQFANWLARDGWPASESAELCSRFSDQCRLLSQYAEEASAA
jgi:hypothetical protein